MGFFANGAEYPIPFQGIADTTSHVRFFTASKKKVSSLQVNNYEIIVNFFRISHDIQQLSINLP